MFTKRGTWLLAIATLAALATIATACSGGSGYDGPTPTPEATTTLAGTSTPQTTAGATNTPIPGLSIEDLRNATYPSDITESGTVTLVDGLFEDRVSSNGFESPLGVRFGSEVGLGDLDGDGMDDAAVTLVVNTGGTGSFVNLFVVLNQDGAPAPIASVFLGDRVIVEAIRIAESRIELDMITHAPSDGFCCPSLTVLRTYALEDSSLTLLEELPR